MIVDVLLNGSPIPLDEVFAELTIRHGRGSIDDGPLASTATLTLVDVDRPLVQGFSAGDTLELATAAGPRFTGRVTDATLGETGLQIVAVGGLARIGARPIGTADYPEEPWSARIVRAFQDAGVLLTWPEAEGTWADGAGDWVDAGLSGRLALELGAEPDPLVAFREHDRTTLADYLALLRDTVGAVVADLPDGSLLVQRLDARSTRPTLDLDPADILYAPDFGQADAVLNTLDLTYGEAAALGPVTADDPDSVNRFEVRAESLQTYLVNVADAEGRANQIVTRRAWPRWTAEPVDLLQLDETIGIGSPVRLHDLPDWAPDTAYLGIVEGWEDVLRPADWPPGSIAWTMRLFLSDPRLSGGFGTLWATVPPETSWAEAAPATWNDPDTLTEVP